MYTYCSKRLKNVSLAAKDLPVEIDNLNLIVPVYLGRLKRSRRVSL